MKLRYRGVQENLKLEMDYLIAGPYFVDGHMADFEVEDADGQEMLRINPRMFFGSYPARFLHQYFHHSLHLLHCRFLLFQKHYTSSFRRIFAHY